MGGNDVGEERELSRQVGEKGVALSTWDSLKRSPKLTPGTGLSTLDNELGGPLRHC